MENTLLDVMYELPSMKGIKKCLVTADAIRGIGPVDLIRESGEESKTPRKKSA